LTAKKPLRKKHVPAKRVPGAPNPKMLAFVNEYLVDLNATQAAIRAGYSAKSAGAHGFKLLQKAEIQAAIDMRRREVAQTTNVTPERVIAELGRIAFADPRELVEIKVGCCRHCHGEGFKYQRSVGEMNVDMASWTAKGNSMADFDNLGGIGFNPLTPPHAECTACGGDGEARTVLKDTSRLSPSALALYAGAKATKYGIEVAMHSKDAALEKLAKHYGIYERDNNQKTGGIAALLAGLSGNVIGPVREEEPETPVNGDDDDEDEP
jgi:hypothetical protein